MRYEHSKDIFTREIMDLWEAAYDRDNFVCLFNRKEIAGIIYNRHTCKILFFGKVKRRVSSERVNIVKGKNCAIAFALPDHF